jgi:hypothetical protein
LIFKYRAGPVPQSVQQNKDTFFWHAASFPGPTVSFRLIVTYRINKENLYFSEPALIISMLFGVPIEIINLILFTTGTIILL